MENDEEKINNYYKSRRRKRSGNAANNFLLVALLIVIVSLLILLIFLLTKCTFSISIRTTNSELGELVASITLANPFLFFLGAGLRGSCFLD